jgi:hypothetical protein|tara:strand:- start:2170 stop:2379 length:210 start_codon:yes stop_codon:yes gene_type:complete
MIRNDTRLAMAIAEGSLNYGEDTCTTEGCENRLLEPAAFNPTSRIDNEIICNACRSWEMIQGKKYPNIR